MSDKMRWRYGDTNPVIAAVDASTVIAIGDLLWQDTNQAKPASDCSLQIQDITSEQSGIEQLMVKFIDNFLGVAMQRSRDGDTEPIRVATTGVFEFDCPCANFELGDLIGAEFDQDSAKLMNQMVRRFYGDGGAIGRCAKRGRGIEHVLVDIRSTVMTGGVVSR